ncbi:tetratricopeptide repeat protein [Myxococcus qinghaiensis]|uniref:tetratricopeptide repeat protein n=1 Tax=Myxococcus qinghaiensis TaxID=2906758 RepID=UPI0020A82223|nr:tetratricopeptide repeat protein [Myxococcus qinghaiensis]MCP3163674.1 tetratricopeptide repeat protein [Myxococcus qinghaiensis]
MVFVRRSVIALSALLLLGAAEPSESARAAFARGESALSSGRLDEAAAAYRESLSATPGYAPALNGLGSVLFRQGQLKDAIARFTEAAEADPQHKMAFFNLGYAARKAGDSATAARAYARYVQLEPDDADGYYGLAESHRQLGDKSQAIAAYQGYIARERRPSEQIWVQKARGHLKALGGQPLPANEAARPALGAEPSNGVLREKGATPSAMPVAGAAQPGAGQTGTASQLASVAPAGTALSGGNASQVGNSAAAGTASSVGNAPQVASAAPAGAASSPGSASQPESFAQAGSASQPASAQQEPLPFPSTRAASDVVQERTSNPALAAARIRDGDALMKERRYREAAFAFLDASHADAGHVEALFKLGNALAVLGYYGQAVEKWETATRLTQDTAIRQSAQDNITRARAKLAQVGASPQAAGQAPGSGPVADPTRAQARRAYEQGVQRIGTREFSTALTHLTQAIQLEPMLAVAYTARGSANIGLRRYAEAAADYQFALELEPQSASPLYGLAESYRALGRNAEARGLYERYAASSAADVRPQLQEESRQKATKLR